ncbi:MULTISPECIES: hypothetical protein [Gordonia]|uniref:Lipoprotein n=1 Tax=Gordonia alkanivorans CGMCC 6845 TaxID=1423140 RepID=W9DEQ4_9ACTN|nr:MULTISPECIES: hypothetical protein [Gordonia]ETA04886.1 hypothetical protein V525_21610 [Gordonia alkanivorans CGMCC 6845]MDH3009353.1 hypothetical protein [Gordonia alkanivorans]MDH3012563.1 hypothetical protein [Gordonia alkanivorans]MDH3017422.1 hypothetical protein [Gordonia alkanivorans]MDH3022453.1 hypothetical protein [Gordonia alkanivorans]
MRRFAVVLIAVALSVSACSLFSSPDDDTSPRLESGPVTEQTVDVAPDTTTEVAVSDNWAISIPPGAATPGSSFTVRPAEQSTAAGKSVTPVAGADLTLSSGQPVAPLTFRYELDEPLPEGTDLYLVGKEADAPGSAAPATPIAAAIDGDRRVATAQVPHLSTWEWLAVEANHFVTSTLGLRGGAPRCPTQPRPGWLDEAVFLDSKEAPMRVCTGADPADKNIAVVKIRNNRGIAMIVTAPVTPRWAHLDVFSGQPTNVAAEIESATISMLGVPTSVRSRTWVLPPGGGVDIGFTASSLPVISKITATATVSTVLYGVLWTQLEDLVDDPLTLSAMELGFMAACFGQAVDSGLAGMSDSQVRAAATSMTAVGMCLAQKAPDVVGEIAGHLSEQAFEQMQNRKIAEKVGRTYARYLPLLNTVTTGLVVADAVASVNLGAGAWEISLFKKIDPEYSLNAACGRIDDRRTVDHPSLGTVTIGLRRGENSLAGEGCIVAVDSKGKRLLVQTVSVYGNALDFADPATDTTENVFITYNPGRYDGVITLVPTATGYADIGWEKGGLAYQSTTHAYYFAEVVGPGSDGRYAIKTFDNNCEPDCAGGTVTTKILRWNGQRYV